MFIKNSWVQGYNRFNAHTWTVYFPSYALDGVTASWHFEIIDRSLREIFRKYRVCVCMKTNTIKQQQHHNVNAMDWIQQHTKRALVCIGWEEKRELMVCRECVFCVLFRFYCDCAFAQYNIDRESLVDKCIIVKFFLNIISLSLPFTGLCFFA